jgi:hypothetical protein
VKAARTYPVPVGARTPILGAAATFDEIDLAATLGNAWAFGVRAKENARLLASLLGDSPILPFAVCTDDGDDIVVYGLVRGDTLLASGGWCPDDGEFIPVDADEVAFCARAFQDGYTSVVLKGYTPVALLAATATSPSPPSPAPDQAQAGPDQAQNPGEDPAGLPAGSRVLAVVDDMDHNAVLDLVAVAPGPVVYRRHDGSWQKDDEFVRVLRSVKPPPVVELDDAQLGSVIPQVDEQTAGQPFKKPDPKTTTAAAAYSDRADEMAIEFALLGANTEAQLRRRPGGPIGEAMSKVTPGGRMPARLKEYWSVGEGGAKIRWGTPGAWRRCHRQLTKYVGPFIAKGLCTNIGKLRGGKGVAWDVGGH